MKKKAEKKSAPGMLATTKEATDKLELQHVKAIQGCCQVIIDQTVKTGTLYLDLCLYIRKNMVSPKLVSREMEAMGFNRQVISRVNKVANAADDVFSQFQARTIGFNNVLALARGGAVVGSLASEMGTDVVDVSSQIEEMEGEEERKENSEPSLPGVTPTPEEVIAKAQGRFDKAAAVVLSVAAQLEFKKQRKVVGGNGYVLLVIKDKKWKPKSAPVANEGTEGSGDK